MLINCIYFYCRYFWCPSSASSQFLQFSISTIYLMTIQLVTVSLTEELNFVLFCYKFIFCIIIRCKIKYTWVNNNDCNKIRFVSDCSGAGQSSFIQYQLGRFRVLQIRNDRGYSWKSHTLRIIYYSHTLTARMHAYLKLPFENSLDMDCFQLNLMKNKPITLLL